MASKKSTKKHYPVVRSMPISSGPAANTLVDTAKALSMANRRLYRFGRNYNVKVDIRNDTASQISVFALRDDWAVQKAYQVAFQQYLDNSAEERQKLTQNQLARWEDFRVEHGLTLAINQATPVLHRPDGAATVLTAGEFSDSNVVDAAGTTRTFTWGDGSSSKYGILTEYDKMGNAQNDPPVLEGDMAYNGIDSLNQDAMSDNLQSDGNAPPYDATGVNGLSPWVRVAVLGQTAGAQKLSSGFFTAPCGLVLLAGFSDTGTGFPVSIEVKSGDYKGVHAPSMIEISSVNRTRKVVK